MKIQYIIDMAKSEEERLGPLPTSTASDRPIGSGLLPETDDGDDVDGA